MSLGFWQSPLVMWYFCVLLMWGGSLAWNLHLSDLQLLHSVHGLARILNSFVIRNPILFPSSLKGNTAKSVQFYPSESISKIRGVPSAFLPCLRAALSCNGKTWESEALIDNCRLLSVQFLTSIHERWCKNKDVRINLPCSIASFMLTGKRGQSSFVFSYRADVCYFFP